MLLRGDAEGAVRQLRQSNVQRSEFDVTGADLDPRVLLKGSQNLIAGGDEEDEEEDEDEEGEGGIEELKDKYR